MNLFTLSKAARADLKQIATYTQKVWGSGKRRTYIKELDSAMLFLAENPMSGMQCNYIVSGLRKQQHESHTIFYEIQKDSIFIVRVLHKSMDVESKF